MAATDIASVARLERAAVDSQIADDVSALLTRGDRIAAGERFAEVVERHHRRATRIAYYYLREPAEVDEAVQDAFLKAFVNITSFRERMYFELWFTRILVNGCLDRVKSRARRNRWLVPVGNGDGSPGPREEIERRPALDPSPEATLLHAERRAELLAAVDRLPERQRAVVVLGQFEGHTTREVAAMLGLTEATVRVHLFRAIRSLRRILGTEDWFREGPAPRTDEATDS
jgi:RNA polymerase sigma-70 factor (ECF subfamily)